MPGNSCNLGWQKIGSHCLFRELRFPPPPDRMLGRMEIYPAAGPWQAGDQNGSRRLRARISEPSLSTIAHRARVAAAVLFLITGATVRSDTADDEKAEKVAEAKRFVETHGFADRYRNMQQGFEADIAKLPGATPEYCQAMTEALKQIDYVTQIAGIAGMYLTRDDLIATNRYFAGPVGKRVLELISRLERMEKSGELDRTESLFASNAFFESLSVEDQATVLAFVDSPTGKRFRNAFEEIRKRVGQLFVANTKAAYRVANMRFEELMDERAATQGKQSPGSAPTAPAH